MRHIGILLLIFITISCTKPTKIDEESVNAEVKKAWSGLYKSYENADMGFIDYYQDDVIRMGTDGEYKVGKEVFQESWVEYYKNNNVQVLDYSEPTILPSEDQVVTFNTYSEIFIDKKTSDTTLVEGTWIAIWKKQGDGSWKVRMSTWHN